MPRNKDIKKVLVIGSGPIIIGQAAEFDYAGTQACRSLKEEGMEVVLQNSNPATIMTDKDIADKVYIEPLTVEVVEQLILKEKPDSVLPTLVGQAGLNLAMELEEKGFLKEHNVRLIGPEPITRTLWISLFLGMICSSHHFHKSVKQVAGILWSRAGFWMELHGKDVFACVSHTFVGTVIYIDKSRFRNTFLLKCLRINHISVIL